MGPVTCGGNTPPTSDEADAAARTGVPPLLLQPSNVSLENVTYWLQSVTATGSIPTGWIVVLHHDVVIALYTVWHPLLSNTILAVSAPEPSPSLEGAEEDVVLTLDVLLTDEKVVVLPFASRAVALT